MSANIYSKSKEEIVKEFKDYDEQTARNTYLQVLTDIHKSVSIGCVEKLEANIKVIECINIVENKTILEDNYDFIPNAIRETNLIILACQYAQTGILYFLFGRGCNFLKRFSVIIGNKSLAPDTKDSTGHDCFYYAIRSSNTELLDLLTKKWPDNFFAHKQNFFNEIISKSYLELNLRNVSLSFEMQSYIERKLIDIFFFSNDSNQKEEDKENSMIKVRALIELVLDDIANLIKEYRNVFRVDAKFLYVSKCIAKNIHVLKQQLKTTYDRVPWEEVEFCIICFISSCTKREKINLHLWTVLSVKKILAHLENFSKCLKGELQDIDNINTRDSTTNTALRNESREEVTKNITEKYPMMNKLYNDYKKVRDVYSLEKMIKYINLAISADVILKEGQLIIKRTLQVIKEHLKNNLLYPKLSFHTSHLLITSVSRNTREIITGVSNSLLPDKYLSKCTEFEEETDCELYKTIQNDLQEMGGVIADILHRYDCNALRFILKKFADLKDPAEANEMMELLIHFDVQRIISGIYTLLEQKTIEKFVNKLFILIPNKTFYEEFLFHEIMEIIELEKREKCINMLNSCGLQFLKPILKNTADVNLSIETLNFVKFLANEILECLHQKITPPNLEFIAKSTKDIWSSASPRMNSDERNELDRLFLEIFHIVCFHSENMKGIDELKVTFREQEVERRSSFTQRNLISQVITEEGDYSEKLNLMLNTIKGILSCDGSGIALGNADISEKENMNNQLPALETLILDVTKILENDERTLNNNIFIMYKNFPLRTGKFMWNHLAPDNELMETLLFDPTLATMGIAEKIIENDNLGSIKNLKLATEEPWSLIMEYRQDLELIDNQDELFVSLEVDNFIKVNECLRKGADLFAKSVNSWSTLHFAAKGSRLDIVKFLISKNMNTKNKDDNGQSALHIAAAHGRESTVKYLIEDIQMYVDLVDDYGKTPLHLASLNGHLDVVEVLLKNKASMSCKDIFRYSPLHYAVLNNHMNVVKHMRELEMKENVNEVNDDENLLIIAAAVGNLEMINYLIPGKEKLQKSIAYTNSDSNHGLTPLHIAASLGHFDVAQALVLNGYDVNAKACNEYLPLHYAVEKNHIEIVKLLLDNKEVPGILNASESLQHEIIRIAAENGNKEILQFLLEDNTRYIKGTLKPAALQIAALNGHKEIISILLEKKLDVNSADNLGNTALHKSSFLGVYDSVKFLLSKGANVHITNYKKMSSLHIAIKHGHGLVAEYMISKGASINDCSSKRRTPLHLSALYGNKSVCEILLDFGANIEARDVNMNSPLHLAAQKKDVDIFELLLSRGADTTALNDDGFTPLHIAASCGHEEIVEMLIKMLPSPALTHSDNITQSMSEEEEEKILSKSTMSKIMSLLTPVRPPINIETQCASEEEGEIQSKSIMTSSGERTIVIQHKLKEMHLLTPAMRPINIETQSTSEEEDEILLKYIMILSREGSILFRQKIRKSKSTNAFHETDVINGFNNRGFTSLCTAVTRNYETVAKILLSKGADVNLGKPIAMAVSAGYKNIVDILLKNRNIDISFQKDSDKKSYSFICNCTLLHSAARNGSKHIVEALLSKEINPDHIRCDYGIQTLKPNVSLPIDSREFFDETALHVAAMNGHNNVVQVLLKNGADCNRLNDEGKTPLDLAIAGKHVQVVKTLLYCTKAKEIPCTYLHNATKFGNIDIIQLLMGVKDKICHNCSNEEQPTHTAAKYGHVNILKYFLTMGYDINDCGANSWTLMHYAAMGGFIEVASFLFKENIDVNARDKFGKRPIHLAEEHGHKDMITLLLKNGALCDDLNLCDCDESWRLLKSVMDSNITEVEKFIKEGALINSRYSNYFAVHNYASGKGFTKIVDILKNNKENPNVIEKRGFTLLHFAAMTDNFCIVKILLSNGAIYNMVSECGRTSSNFTQDKDINDLLNLIDESFRGAQNFDFTFIDKLKNLKDISLVKAVMNSQNIDGNSLVVLAIKNNFPRTEELKQIFQDNIVNKIHNARELCVKRKFKEALDILKKIVDKRTEIFGPDNPSTIDIQMEIAEVHEKMLNYKRALEMIQEAFNKLVTVLGSSAKDTLHAKSAIASNLFEQRKWEEVLEVAKELYSTQKEVFGIHAGNTLNTMSLISAARCKQGKIQEAFTVSDSEKYENLLVMSIKTYEKKMNLYGELNEDIWIDVKNIATVLYEQHELNNSLDLMQNLFTWQKVMLGPDNMETLNTQSVMGDILYHQGKHIEACETYTDVFDRRKRILGPKHPRVLDCSTKLKMLNVMLKKNGSGSEILKSSQTCIHYAAASGYVKTVEVLINAGTDPNAVRNCKEQTPMHFAVYNCHLDVVNLLLKKGANVLKATREGNTVLHIATYKDSTKIVKLILLHVQENFTKEELIEFVNVCNTGGFTALYYAAKNNSFDNARSLLEHGATYSLNSDTGSMEVPPEYFLDENFMDLMGLIGEILEYVQRGADSVVLEEIVIEDGVISGREDGEKAVRTASENIQEIIEMSCESPKGAENIFLNRTPQENLLEATKPSDRMDFLGDRMTGLENALTTINGTLKESHTSAENTLLAMKESVDQLQNMLKNVPHYTYTMQFDATYKGKHIELSRDFRTAKRIASKGPHEDAMAGVITNVYLQEDHVFQIRIDESIRKWRNYGMGIGVIKDKEEEIDEKRNMFMNVKGAWGIYSRNNSVSGKADTWKDNVIITKDEYPLDTRGLPVGTLLGVSRRKNGDVHFYLNGVDKGCAFRDVPKDVYGFVEVLHYLTKISITN